MNILFLCVANSARSQLAEGLAKKILGPRHQIESAGSEPSSKVQPWALKILEAEGIDSSRFISKGVDHLPAEFMGRLDFVITLCAEEICPNLPMTAKRLHWPIPDPAAASELDKPQSFRDVATAIRIKLESFYQREQLDRSQPV